MDRFRSSKKDKGSKAKKDDPATAKAASTFADHIAEAHEKLGDLIETKTKDLHDEPKRESYNRTALSKLETMRFHLSQVVDLIDSYRSG